MKYDLAAYSKYRPSPHPWLGALPEHWLLRSLGSLAKPRNERGRPELPLLSVVRERGVILRSSMSDEENHNFVPDDLSNYKVAHSGDLVINKMKAWQGSLGLAPADGVVSPAYFVFNLPVDDRKYAQALLRSRPYVAFFAQASDGVRIGQWDLSPAAMKRIPVCLPPADEQSAIVRFIDHADRSMRRYIATKRKLIAILEEQKQAIVNRAVTRGLDPNVHVRPSRIAWLGDVPEHWKVRRLKSIAKIRYGLGQPPRESATGLPLIRATNVDHGRILERDLVRVDPEDVPRTRNAILSEGEIVVVRSGAYTADSAIVPREYAGSVAGYDMVVTPQKARPDFIALTLLSSYVRDDQLIIASMRSAQPHLNAEELGVALVLVPPEVEQRRIVEHVTNSTKELDAAVRTANREISLLLEFRSRLIADVVTGKIDVREAAAGLRDQTEALEDSVDLGEADAELGEGPVAVAEETEA